eukprot:TRINITY_DN6401_c0_g1_i1.p1 TRINITY_DN6401_c0_g1~~TRINITY_DN6401_c0_g1_i1.p1  ORF type:complete len:625 (+),score=84.98 TRINITY_DN6401_c0_g1_i1:136-2010(+)
MIMIRALAILLLAWLASWIPAFWDDDHESLDQRDDAVVEKSRSVLVIGAGPSGLVALKEMLQHGHNAIAVEQAAEVGGVFGLHSAMLYDGLHLTTSNFFSAFSDFPPEDDEVKYWSAREYGEYLIRYAEHFGLMAKIRLNTRVIHAKLGEQGEWQVTFQSADGRTEVRMFDAMVVGTGTNQEPQSPKFEGFTGEFLHSADYKNAEPFAGKRVLAIGTGESGSDVASSLAAKAASVTVWARRPPLLAPRFLDTPDHENAALNRTGLKPTHMLDSGTTSRAASGMSMTSNAILKWKLLWNMKKKFADHRTLETVWNEMSLEDYPSGFWHAEHVAPITKTLRLAELTHTGAVNMVIARSAHFNGTTATFGGTRFIDGKKTQEHNTSMDFDAIVCSCGYKFHFKWLDIALEPNPRTWFKHAFPPKYANKLFFVGWARPHQGNIFLASELVARYGAMVFAGTRQLPADYEAIAIREGREEEAHYAVNPRLKSLVDLPAFVEAMAELVGCRPRRPSIFDYQHWFAYHFYGRYSAWYRQRGRHAKPEAIDSIIDKFPADRKMVLHPRTFIFLGLLAVQQPITATFKLWSLVSSVVGHQSSPAAPGWMLAMFGRPMEMALHGNRVSTDVLLR